MKTAKLETVKVLRDAARRGWAVVDEGDCIPWRCDGEDAPAIFPRRREAWEYCRQVGYRVTGRSAKL